MTGTLDLLERTRVVAVVGCSRTPGKAAHDVPAELLEMGYDVIPVNPNADELLGRRCYRSLAEVPARIDVVDVFRPSEEAAEVARQAIAVGARAVWLQLDVVSPEARRLCEEAGLGFVEDRCIKVEARRLERRRARGAEHI